MSLHDEMRPARDWMPSDDAMPDDHIAALSRKRAAEMARRLTAAYAMPDEASAGETRTAPRAPRDTEPMPLWEFLAIGLLWSCSCALFALGCVFGFLTVVGWIAQYADAFAGEMANWIVQMMWRLI